MDVVILLPISVKTPTGKTLVVEVSPEASVKDLKEKITTMLKNNYQPNQQILLLKGKQLDETKSLADYKIHQDSTIYVAIKPQPKDIFHFDACNLCNCQAVEPCALPCGHSCCKGCLSADDTHCPVPACASSLLGATKETLPQNWIALQFLDPKAPVKMCQSCGQRDVCVPASHRCTTCAEQAVEPQDFCEKCVLEHANQNKDHLRIPLDVPPTPFGNCKRHKLPKEFFCFDDNAFICKACAAQEHKPHKTKFIQDHAEELKQDLKSSILILTDSKVLEQKEQKLIVSKKEKASKLHKLEQRIEALKKELLDIDKQIEDTQASTQQAKTASVLLLKSVQEFPIKDMFDSNKIKLMKKRIDSVVESVLKEDLPQRPKPRSRPALKRRYDSQMKIGCQGVADGQFNRPYALTVDAQGKTFVVDYGNNRVQVFKSDGTFHSAFGSFGSYDGLLNKPSGIAFDLEGRLVVVDSGNHRLNVYDTNGNFKLSFGTRGTGDARLQSPHGIAVCNQGNYVVSDCNNHRISIWNSEGTWLRKFGSPGTGPGEFSFPRGVAVDSDGSIIVSDNGNHRVQKFSSNGEFIRSFGSNGTTESKFNFPWGIAVDQDCNIVVCDQRNNRVQIFGPDGTFITSFGSEGQLSHPLDPVIDPEGRIFVTEYTTNRIQRFG